MAVAGLRERKKLETHRALVRAAHDLVTDAGLDGVTVDQIAAAAGVSTRTFFNYFSSKEEAVVALDPTFVAEQVAALRARPVEESPVEALRAALFSHGGPDETLRRWRHRHELVAGNPRLFALNLATRAAVSAALGEVLAEREGIDPEESARAHMLVAAVLATTYTAIEWWLASDGSRPLTSVVEEAFDLLEPARLTSG